MDSELLHALDPTAVQRREEAGPQPARAEPPLRPLFARPPDTGAHRSELEYAMTESPQAQQWNQAGGTPVGTPTYITHPPWLYPVVEPQIYDTQDHYTGAAYPPMPAYSSPTSQYAPSSEPATPAPNPYSPSMQSYTQAYSPNTFSPTYDQSYYHGLPNTASTSSIPGPSSSSAPQWPPYTHPPSSGSTLPTRYEDSSLHGALDYHPAPPRPAIPPMPRRTSYNDAPADLPAAEASPGAGPSSAPPSSSSHPGPVHPPADLLYVKRGLPTAPHQRMTPLPTSPDDVPPDGRPVELRAPLGCDKDGGRPWSGGRMSRQASPMKVDEPPPPPPWAKEMKIEGQMVPYEPRSAGLPAPYHSQEALQIMSEESASEAEASTSRRAREKAYKQKDCLTIQTAMRRHIVRTMGLSSDKALPDSHDGSPIPPNAPVRFVWTQTVLKSHHNQNMRTRVVDSLMVSRELYPHVPEAAFDDREALEGTFDQSFTTIRSKWRAQRNPEVAAHEKRREDAKGIKSRRMLRKKAKLVTRKDARAAADVFKHESFDGAFQLACMSSEESASDSDAAPPRAEAPPIRKSAGRLITRPPAWRSSQLYRFFDVLDDTLATAATAQPKRGAGKKERVRGEPRPATRAMLPPKGVGMWMISKRWARTTKEGHPALDVLLQQVADGGTLADGHDFVGESSDDELD